MEWRAGHVNQRKGVSLRNGVVSWTCESEERDVAQE